MRRLLKLGINGMNFKYIMKIIYLSLILFLIPLASLAKYEYLKEDQEPNYLKIKISNGLSLDDATKIAIENNLEIKSKQAKIKVAEAEVKTASAFQNPYLEGFESRAENTYFGALNYMFETAGKRGKRKEIALKNLEAAKKELEASIWNLRSNIRQLYTKLLIDEEWFTVKKDRVLLNEELVNIAKKRFEAGDVPIVDVKLAEQALLNSQSEFVAFKNEVLTDRINLNLKLSLEPLSKWTIETKIEELSKLPKVKNRDELVKIGLENKAELKEALLNVHSAQAELRLAKSLKIPNIQESLGVVTSNALNTSNTTPNVFSTSIRTDTNIELPILNRYKGPVEEAKAKIDKYTYDRIFLIQQILGLISSSYEKLMSMEERLELAKKATTTGEEIVSLLQKGYSYGKMNLLQVLSAKQNLKQAQDNYHLTLIEEQNTISELEKALGVTLDEVAL